MDSKEMSNQNVNEVKNESDDVVILETQPGEFPTGAS